jgi:hypothetical protein
MLGSHATLCGSRDSTTVDLSKTFEVGRPSISTCQALRPNPLYLFQAGRTFCIHFLPVKCHYFRSICALFFLRRARVLLPLFHLSNTAFLFAASFSGGRAIWRVQDLRQGLDLCETHVCQTSCNLLRSSFLARNHHRGGLCLFRHGLRQRSRNLRGGFGQNFQTHQGKIITIFFCASNMHRMGA